MKLKSPHHVRYRLSIGLWGIEVISASKRSECIIGAKKISNILQIGTFDCYRYRLITSDIGLGLSSHSCQCCRPTIDSGNEISALNIVLQKKKQSEYFRKNFPKCEFSTYVLQRGQFVYIGLEATNKFMKYICNSGKCSLGKCASFWFILFIANGFSYVHFMLCTAKCKTGMMVSFTTFTLYCP